MFAERKAKAVEGMQQEEPSFQEPDDVRLIRQVLSWCKAQMPKQEHAAAPSHETAQQTQRTFDAPEGTVLFAKNDDKDP